MSLDAAPADVVAAVKQAQKEAERKGYERGVQDGLAAARAEVGGAVERLHAAASAVEEVRAALAREMVEDCARLAVLVASKILRREWSREDTIAQIANALKQTPDRQELTIRLNPGEFEDVGQAIQTCLPGMDPAALHLVADEGVGWGGCIVDGPSGRVDARLETQLREIEKVLLAEGRDANSD